MNLNKEFKEGQSAAHSVYPNQDHCPYPHDSDQEAAWLGGFYEETHPISCWGDDHIT